MNGWNIISKYRTSIIVATTACLGLFAARRYFAGGFCTSTNRLDGKTVIITGANSGIGRETAKELSRRGARVILACRDVLKAERVAADIKKETGRNDVLVQQLDLSSLESVRKFSERIKATEGRLDILINNAGIMACPEWSTKDGFEMQLGTNHLGHFLLTNLLLDLLKKSAPSRIINVSSLAHERGKINFDNINLKGEYDAFGAYSQSKLANVLFTKELARRLSHEGVAAYSLHPGVVKTELGRHFLLNIPWYRILVFKIVSPVVIKTPWEGAQTTLHCALADNLPNGAYFSDCAVKDPAPQAKSDEVARRLWDLSEELVGLKK